eukprot:1154468-Rhodomonas_salina.2
MMAIILLRFLGSLIPPMELPGQTTCTKSSFGRRHRMRKSGDEVDQEPALEVGSGDLLAVRYPERLLVDDADVEGHQRVHRHQHCAHHPPTPAVSCSPTAHTRLQRKLETFKFREPVRAISHGLACSEHARAVSVCVCVCVCGQRERETDRQRRSWWLSTRRCAHPPHRAGSYRRTPCGAGAARRYRWPPAPSAPSTRGPETLATAIQPPSPRSQAQDQQNKSTADRMQPRGPSARTHVPFFSISTLTQARTATSGRPLGFKSQQCSSQMDCAVVWAGACSLNASSTSASVTCA